jgi:hypothetical protein
MGCFGGFFPYRRGLTGSRYAGAERLGRNFGRVGKVTGNTKLET